MKQSEMRRGIGYLLLVLLFGAIAVAQTYNESPMLQSLVEEGTLPPVEERLPENPFVVEPFEEIGQYGGTARLIHTAPQNFVSIYGWIVERMLRVNAHDVLEDRTVTIEPNIFESWEMSEDGTTFTFQLREGMRWSDGEPVTTEDVRFWYEDVLLNEELTPVIGREIWMHGGQVVQLEIVDDYTFTMQFAAPHGTFPLRLTRLHLNDVLTPSHVMKQYHIAYADADELAQQVAEAGYDHWYQLYSARNYGGPWNALAEPYYPTLQPWLIVDRPAPGVTMLERNPYYWKVDRQGNQLPYIDRLRVELVQSHEVATFKAISGELDWLGMHDVSIANYPLYQQHAAGGGYRIMLYDGAMTDHYILNIHPTPVDPVKREVFDDVRFRRALSLGIDREEINDILFHALGQPSQITVVPWSVFYEERFQEAWADYDPDQANALLDEMGLEVGPDGYRLGPDGNRFSFIITHAGPRVGVLVNSFADLVVEMWQELGLDVRQEQVEESIFFQRRTANEVDIWIWHLDAITDMLFPISPGWFVPYAGTDRGLWSQWYQTGGDAGEEPPQHVLEMYEAMEVMKGTPDEEEFIGAGKRILEIATDQLHVIGSMIEVPVPLIVAERLRNVPEGGVIAWDTFDVDLWHPEQFYIQE